MSHDSGAGDEQLRDGEVERLRDAAAFLIDIGYDEHGDGVWRDEQPAASIFYDALPRAWLIQRHAGTYRQFWFAVIVVADRLQHPIEMARPNCLVEALALRTIIEHARARMEEDGVAPSEAMRSLEELVFDDLDHEFVFDPAFDGIDEDPSLRTGPLTRSQWGIGWYGRRAHPMYETRTGD